MRSKTASAASVVKSSFPRFLQIVTQKINLISFWNCFPPTVLPRGIKRSFVEIRVQRDFHGERIEEYKR